MLGVAVSVQVSPKLYSPPPVTVPALGRLALTVIE